MSGKTDENKYNTYISKDETKCKQILFQKYTNRSRLFIHANTIV